MKKAMAALLLAAGILCGAGPSSGATIVRLALDPALSTVTPAIGAAESVSGTLALRIGTLPAAGVTSFDLVELALSTAGGGSIGLDPAIANPGLGLLTPDGAFTIATLFLRLSDGVTALDLSLPDLAGHVVFGPARTSIVGAATQFSLVGPDGPIEVSLVAVPEASSAWLVGTGLCWLARGLRRSPRAGEPVR